MSNTSLISRIFGGRLKNEVKCTQCNYSSCTYNHFHDISLDFQRVKHNKNIHHQGGGYGGSVFQNQGNKSSSSQNHCSLVDMISAFVKIEKLTEGNEWQCDRCKKKVKVSN